MSLLIVVFVLRVMPKHIILLFEEKNFTIVCSPYKLSMQYGTVGIVLQIWGGGRKIAPVA